MISYVIRCLEYGNKRYFSGLGWIIKYTDAECQCGTPSLPTLQNVIFWPNRSSDKKLYNRPFLGLVLSDKKGFFEMGVAWKLSLPRPLEWKITYSSKKGVATLIFMPRPCPFRFTQRDTRAIIPESFIKLSSPILKWQKFEF